MPSCAKLCLTIPFQPGLFSVFVNYLRFVYFVLHVLPVYLYLTSTIWQILTPFHHGMLDQIVVAYATSTKAKLPVIMLNHSRFVYSVLRALLSLFVFSLDHLTTGYVISLQTTKPNRCSLCQFDNESYATCHNYAEPFEVCLFRFTYIA